MIHKLVMSVFFIVFLAGCAGTTPVRESFKPLPPSNQTYFKVGNPYVIDGRKYYPQESYNLVETGIASWYGPNFHGKPTANGETFDMFDLGAAHRTLQIPSIIRVTNMRNGRTIKLRVNDRGPFKKNRVLDVSMRGAELLGFKDQGTTPVKIEVLPIESRIVAEAAKNRQKIDLKEAIRLAAIQRGERGASTQIASKTSQDKPSVLIANDFAAPPTQQKTTRQQEKSNSNQAASIPGRPLKLLSQDELASLATQAEPFQNMTHVKPVQVEQIGGEEVEVVPVAEPSLFIQAASFSNQSNAYRLATQLKAFGPTRLNEVTLNNKRFFRVQIGPLGDVDQADIILNRVWEEMGLKDARIIVEQQRQSL